jgi:uncharacterized LabA/DUF88 family protein
MIQNYVRGRVYVFIDAANLESAVKDAGWWIDYQKLYLFFKSQTDLVQIRFYCVKHDTKSQNGFFTVLKRFGYKLTTKPLKIIRHSEGHTRKANFDVEIALDAYISKDNFDTLVLFSGDSDFKYLVEVLRKEGKRVVVISSKFHVSKELIEAADKFIPLKKLKQFIRREGR